jgi:hypothetical protein
MKLYDSSCEISSGHVHPSVENVLTSGTLANVARNPQSLSQQTFNAEVMTTSLGLTLLTKRILDDTAVPSTYGKWNKEPCFSA